MTESDMLTWAAIDAAMQAAPGTPKDWPMLASLVRNGASAPDDMPCAEWANLKGTYDGNVAFITNVVYNSIGGN